MKEFDKKIRKLKIAITSDCILRCSHCNIDKSLGHTVKFKDALKALDVLMASFGEKKRLEIYGGEPFMKFELVKKIVKAAYAARDKYLKNISISIATNGILLNSAHLKFLKDNSINISISVSGSEKSHDFNRMFPDGTGSHGKLKENLKKVFAALDAKDIVALLCVDPANAKSLYSDFLKVVGLGFKIINIECVHGKEWAKEDFLNLKSNLLKIRSHITREIKKDNFMYLEPFAEFVHSDEDKESFDCPFLKDLELYPDGSYSFYPYSFINYEKDIKTAVIGTAQKGFKKRYEQCRIKSGKCVDCVQNYYTIKGLSSGSFAYSLRTDVFRSAVFDILKRSKTDLKFKEYARNLFNL